MKLVRKALRLRFSKVLPCMEQECENGSWCMKSAFERTLRLLSFAACWRNLSPQKALEVVSLQLQSSKRAVWVELR